MTLPRVSYQPPPHLPADNVATSVQEQQLGDLVLILELSDTASYPIFGTYHGIPMDVCSTIRSTPG